jgi:hypothetical protein
MKTMKIATVFMILLLAGSFALTAQQPPAPAPADPASPTLTLDEKIALTMDDLKLGDSLEKAQKAYFAEIKPIQDHQAATKAALEKDHPGWTLETGPQGWHFVKAPEKKAESPAKPAEAPKKN